MKFFILIAFIIAVLVPVNAFISGRVANARQRIVSAGVTTAEKQIVAIDAPDFYWQYRLDRLVSKKGGDLAFSASSYPELTDAKSLYDAYYLDLTLQGKMEGFDWVAEKEIGDSEWLAIYKNICDWSSKAVKENKPDTSNLPASDFDLLKQFYPQLNFRELEAPFAVEEVGNNFPYRTMKDMLTAAMKGTLSVPGYDAKSITSLEASDVRKELAALKEKTMKNLDVVYEDVKAFAANPFPDDESRKHYKDLSAKLAGFPQTPADWNTYRAKMEKDVDEMARLASKPEDPHHHHGEDDKDHVSPAQEFEQKYGRNLEEMQERMNKYKSDPEGFLEASILEKFGKNGLDIWKKSQDFSANMSVMSESDKAAAEKAFADFLKKA
jgi:hypothetical protein